MEEKFVSEKKEIIIMENHWFLEFLAEDDVTTNILQQIPDLLQTSLFACEIFKGRESVKARNEKYFEETIPRYNDNQFKEHFRMTKSTFESLLHVIGHQLIETKQPIENVCLEKKLLLTIWLLSKPESFLAAGDRFNIPNSSAHGIFKFIVSTLADLMPRFVNWPTSEQIASSSQVFLERSRGIEGVIGAIDGCHIPIKQPIGNAADYYNRKQFHSIILQGVCDHHCRFIDVFIGMPGKMHDARVFRHSDLFEKITNQQNPLMQPDQHLIGDCAYPLMVNLMTPFRDNGHLPASHVRYNTRLSSIRSVIERAFGLLKVKFRRLKYLDISYVEFGNKIIAAACMLHNFIIDNGEIEDILQRDLDEDTEVNSPEETAFQNSLEAQDAANKRNNIARTL